MSRMLVLCALLSAATTACIPPGGGLAPRGAQLDTCGVVRWGVKTLSDADTAAISFTAETTTVVALRAKAAPARLGRKSPRQRPDEFNTFVVREVKLVKATREDDEDIHLVIAHPSDPADSMIVEFPNVNCTGAGTSPWKAQMQQARYDLITACGDIPTRWVYFKATVFATIKGVGFFDNVHNQAGGAPNGMELHPVLEIKGLPARPSDCR